jgi:hypothetical protein
MSGPNSIASFATTSTGTILEAPTRVAGDPYMEQPALGIVEAVE